MVFKKMGCRILGRLCDKESIPVIIKLLNDTEDVVRLRSAWALGQIGGESVVTPLMRTSKEDKLKAVREQVKTSLENIRHSTGKITIKDAPVWLLIAGQDLPQAELVKWSGLSRQKMSFFR